MPHGSPLTLLFATVAGWLNRHQAHAIEYLVEENRVLKEQLGDRRLRLTDGQRRRLAAKGHPLGRAALAKVATIVTPETILRWHRQLIAAKWTTGGRRVGRPGLMKEIRELIVRMARDNPTWGYCRIQGELKKVGHRVAWSTIAKTLKDQGVPPSTDRTMSWRTFLKAHADVIAAADFFTTEVWTTRGLVTVYTLFAIDHATRRVHIAGTTPSPDGRFMAQVARQLTDAFDGFLGGKRFLILDRDSKFGGDFARILRAEGIEIIQTAYQAPDMNAIAERWVLSSKRECLNRMIFFGTRSLRRAIDAFVAHYNAERPHQGVGNVPLEDREVGAGAVVVDERLGGLLKCYRRAA